MAAVVDCPSLDYLNSLISDPAWDRFFSQPDQPDGFKTIDIMCHLAIAEVSINHFQPLIA